MLQCLRLFPYQDHLAMLQWKVLRRNCGKIIQTVNK